jgi:hypothetical protein
MDYGDSALNFSPPPALTAALSKDLAGFSAKFAMAPASSPYLHETRFLYTSLGAFYGSDYFFARMGSQVSTLPKRLGDAFMDTELVDQAVIQQTGQRFLNTSYISDSLQMKALSSSHIAITTRGSLQLSEPGFQQRQNSPANRATPTSP